MSMRDYGVDDYGLVLDEETIKIIASKVFDDYKENENAMALAYELYDRGICEYIGGFTGEAQELDGQGLYWGGDSIEYYSDVVIYLQADIHQSCS